jgi:hypothetical protein
MFGCLDAQLEGFDLAEPPGMRLHGYFDTFPNSSAQQGRLEINSARQGISSILPIPLGLGVVFCTLARVRSSIHWRPTYFCYLTDPMILSS